MKFATILSVLCVLAPPAALAKDRVMQCDFPENSSGGGGWTSGPLVFHIKDDAEVATVNNGAIAHFVGQPIEAKVLKDLPGHIALKWELKGKDSANQYSRFEYRLNVLDGGATARLTARPLSYDNDWQNTGTCKSVKK